MTLIWKIFQANIGKSLDECDMIHQASNPDGSEGTECPQCPVSTENPVCPQCPTCLQCAACPECPACQDDVGSQEREEICPSTGM